MEYAGLDAHKLSVQVCVKEEHGKVLKEQNYPTHDAGLERLYQTVKNAKCVIEASTACYQIYDYLRDRGVQVRVAHPKRVKAICSAKLKTDKVDARMLADLERANLIPEAHIPSKEVRDKRDLIRHHISLTEQHTRLINQTKAALLRYRVRLPKNIFTKKAQRLADASEVPGSLRLKLVHAKQQHELLKKELGEVDGEIEAAAQQNKDALLLSSSFRGIASFLSLGIILHVDGVKRFPDSAHLVSYMGLSPRISQSGESLHVSGVSKDSSGILRWMMIQAAWNVVRFEPHFAKMYRKLLRKGKSEQKSIVIVAKRLARIIYCMLRDQTTFRRKEVGC